MTKSEKKEQEEETKTMLFTRMVDKMLNYHKDSQILTIECGSWTSMYRYIVEDNPDAGEATAFAEFAQECPRIKCLENGGGSVKIEIRRRDV